MTPLRLSEDGIIALAMIGTAGTLILLLILCAATASYLESEGPNQRRKHKAAKRHLELERLRAELDMDLTLKELHAMGTAEDLKRHRERLNQRLDEAHGIGDRTEEEPCNDAGDGKGDTKWLA